MGPNAGDALDGAFNQLRKAADTTKERLKMAGTDADKYSESLISAMQHLPLKYHHHKTHPRFTVSPTPHGVGGIWKETAEWLSKHDEKRGAAAASRFRSS